jgi:uncharacterized protein (UPF0333 family)
MMGNKRGQSTLEYGLLIAVIVVALLVVNMYMKRGVQGRLRSSVDQVGRQFDANTYTLGWQTTSSGNTVTTETREKDSLQITTDTTASETITRGEKDYFGNNATQVYQ